MLSHDIAIFFFELLWDPNHVLGAKLDPSSSASTGVSSKAFRIGRLAVVFSYSFARFSWIWVNVHGFHLILFEFIGFFPWFLLEFYRYLKHDTWKYGPKLCWFFSGVILRTLYYTLGILTIHELGVLIKQPSNRFLALLTWIWVNWFWGTRLRFKIELRHWAKLWAFGTEIIFDAPFSANSMLNIAGGSRQN